jgi:hypothetical protein
VVVVKDHGVDEEIVGEDIMVMNRANYSNFEFHSIDQMFSSPMQKF